MGSNFKETMRIAADAIAKEMASSDVPKSKWITEGPRFYQKEEMKKPSVTEGERSYIVTECGNLPKQDKQERLQKLLQLTLDVRKSMYELNRAYAGPGSEDKFKTLLHNRELAEDALWDFVDEMPEMDEFDK